MNVNLTVCDEYSGLATLLASLIAKYADVLELEDNTAEDQHPTIDSASHLFDTDVTQGSYSQASLLFFLLQNIKQHDTIIVKILSKAIVGQVKINDP